MKHYHHHSEIAMIIDASFLVGPPLRLCSPSILATKWKNISLISHGPRHAGGGGSAALQASYAVKVMEISIETEDAANPKDRSWLSVAQFCDLLN